MLCLKWSCIGLEPIREKLTNTFMSNQKIVKGAHPPNVHINKQLVVKLLSFLLHVVMTDASQDGPQPSGQRERRRNTNYTSDTWSQHASPKIPQAFKKVQTNIRSTWSSTVQLKEYFARREAVMHKDSYTIRCSDIAIN